MAEMAVPVGVCGPVGGEEEAVKDSGWVAFTAVYSRVFADRCGLGSSRSSTCPFFLSPVKDSMKGKIIITVCFSF